MVGLAATMISMVAPALNLNAQGAYVNFESPQVSPLAISPDGSLLFAANTADARLSVFSLALPSGPVLIKEIPVGIEPVSVRARTNDEVWVVNHTSDSVSVVSVSLGIVTDTIVCKDEPCDIVFAGSPQKAYVSAARSNAIRVFDITTHAQIASISVFGENPRALASSADGTKVWAAFAQSGNRTTIVPATNAPAQPPPTNPNLPAPPQVGLIIDATNPTWLNIIKYTMPDNDVVEINTINNTVTKYFPRVGTHNTGIALRPGSNELFVANTDARNLVRFEPNLRGHSVDNRVSRVNTATNATTYFDLNPGVNYGVLPNPAAIANGLAAPMQVVFDATGQNLYVASFGTDRVAKLDPNGNILARIEINPQAPGSIVDSRNMRGPRGLALHPSNGRLYVQNRISNTISVVHTATDSLVNEVPVGAYDPTPASIRDGRGFLYDAKLSGNGTQSCSSCHYDGDMDLIAWDLGDPAGDMLQVNNPNPPPLNTPPVFSMHPMKGPLVTQSLKGLAGAGQNPLHWRGDRTDFTAFNGAFSSLLGGSQLTPADINAFRDFALTLTYEPNPNQNLDRTLPSSVAGFAGNPQTGQTTYLNNQYQPLLTCNTCHIQNQAGGSQFIIPANLLQVSQDFNVPQLRNMYHKINFNNATGAQSIGGFGFTHDGMFPTLFSFLSIAVFGNVTNDAVKKNNLQAFMLCFDTGVAPAAGYGRSIRQANASQAAVTNDVTLLQGQAVTNIDLIGKGLIDGMLRGLLYQPGPNNYKTDKTGIGPFTWAQLQAKALAGNAQFTLMGVPRLSGQRMGIDRNLDGTLDGDEVITNPVQNYGTSSPACAGALTMGVNSLPVIGNDYFAFTCTNTAPSSLALGLVTNNSLPGGMPFFGFDLLVDLGSPEVYALDMPSDPSGFAVAPIAIPMNPLLVGLQYAAQAVTLAPCAPSMVAGSDGLLITIIDF